MRRVLAILLVLAGCGTAAGDSPAPSSTWYLQVNLAGGWADGAELRGADDVVVALVDAVDQLPVRPDAIILNEACERHAADLARLLGPTWRHVFVQAWDGHSDCFPVAGDTEGRFGNAVVVRDVAAAPVVIPSCNDGNAEADRCLPNWAPPAEQRRGACAQLSEGDVLVCSFHLDPRHWAPHDDQLRALGDIAGRLADKHDLVVVGGDLNDGRASVASAFDERFVDLTAGTNPRTYPASAPRRDLDHLLAAGRDVLAGGGRTIDLGRCEATFHDDGRCTDHLGLLAALVLG